MNPEPRKRAGADRLLQIAGLATWAIAAAEQIQLISRRGGFSQFGESAVRLLALAAFGAGFWWGSASWLRDRAQSKSEHRARGVPALVLQTAAATLLVGLGGAIDRALFVVTAGQAPFLFSRFGAGAWVVAQTGLLSLAVWKRQSVGSVAASAGILLAFQVFALAASYLVQKEYRARLELRRLGAELAATEQLVAEVSRMDERLRVSREVHDSVGHYLTALSLNLEAAMQSSNEKHANLEKPYALTKQLIADVKEVLQILRKPS
jgi:signal transduction histidine kinase